MSQHRFCETCRYPLSGANAGPNGECLVCKDRAATALTCLDPASKILIPVIPLISLGSYFMGYNLWGVLLATVIAYAVSVFLGASIIWSVLKPRVVLGMVSNEERVKDTLYLGIARAVILIGLAQIGILILLFLCRPVGGQ